MPSLHNLNSPPHPFWDFVASLNENANSPSQPQNHAQNQQASSGMAAEPSSADKANVKERQQPTVEDEVVAESPLQPEKGSAEAPPELPERGKRVPFVGRERGRCGREGFAPREWHRGGPETSGRRPRRCYGWMESGGPHPAPPEEGNTCTPGNPFGNLGHFGPSHATPRPPNGFPGSHQNHPHHPRSHPNHCRRETPNNFNLGEFLASLGSRIGLDLNGVGTSLARDLFTDVHNTGLPEGVDFEPRADIFELPTAYLAHLSLPGAKKEDLGVDWDGENSSLRVGGVVHRPGVNEETLKLLAVDGRKREVGVFEKKIRFGSRREPATVDVAGIKAKMTDGVLMVRVPKIEVELKKRQVPISSASSSASASPPTSPLKDERASDYQAAATEKGKADPPTASSEKGKQAVSYVSPEAAVEFDRSNDHHHDIRSQTIMGDDLLMDDNTGYDDPPEQLPQYRESDTGRNTSAGESDGEGEEVDYVKIDVN